MAEIIDNTLGSKGKPSQYSHSDIFATMSAIYLTGGSCIEDSNRLSRILGEKSQGYRFCSADTVLRAIQSLASQDTECASKEGKAHNFNINRRLNILLLKGLVRTGQVDVEKAHTFDYDNQFIAAGKHDARYSYKGAYGHFPGIAQVDGLPFYIEGRDGNANVKFEQSATLERAFDMAKKAGVRFDCARMDCGSYSKEIVEVVASNCERFYIRAMSSASLRDRIAQIPQDAWTDAEIGYQKCKLASIPFTAFLAERGYRLVVQRTRREDGQTDLFEGEYVHRCILTSDTDSSEQKVVEFYNLRASTEQTFDCMNNDFGWGHLPFSFLSQNTAFMTLTAFLHNYYRHFVAKVARLNFALEKVSRVKRFVFAFVSVPFRWVVRNRRKVLALYTNNPAYLQLQV